MSTQYVRLGPTEMVDDHPFTNPVDSVEDITTLEYIAGKLRYLLRQLDAIPPHPRPWVRYLQEEDGRYLRMALSKPESLLKSEDLTVVGFCGRKWPHANREPLDAVDKELISEFPQHPHLLSYSSLELKCSNWCNLVIFDHPRGLKHWSTSSRHAYAAQTLTPGYYKTIRLHNFVLPGGLVSGHKLVLVRTKYYDYQGESLWWAVRDLA